MSIKNIQPPSLEQVTAVIERFEVQPSKMAAAALHLATPENSVYGIDIHHRGKHYLWRGSSVAQGFGVAGCAGRAVELAALSWRPGESGLDLEGDCLKVVRSGAHNLIAGSFLYGGGEILCGVEIKDPLKVAEAWLRRDLWGRSGVVEIDGDAYLVSGDERVVVIHGEESDLSEGSAINCDIEDTETVGKLIQTMLDLDTIEAVGIGSRVAGTTDIDYIGTITEGGVVYDVIIPCTIGAGLSIGAPSGVAAPSTIDWYRSRRGEVAWFEIGGYAPIEPARLEPGWVARHDNSGLSVIVRLNEG